MTEIQMVDAQIDLNVHTRIRAEYYEMPGMRLTAPQAARLFNLELVMTAARSQTRPRFKTHHRARVGTARDCRNGFS